MTAAANFVHSDSVASELLISRAAALTFRPGVPFEVRNPNEITEDDFSVLDREACRVFPNAVRLDVGSSWRWARTNGDPEQELRNGRNSNIAYKEAGAR